MATERIEIIVTENGTNVVITKLEGVAKTAKTSASAVDLLKAALASIGAAATIQGLVDLLDVYQQAANRLSFVSHSQDEVAFSMQKLLEIANTTRQSFEDTAGLYTRLAFATDQLGISHADAARVVQTLQEAITLSGASTREANAALVHFTQGLAAGTLRGRELRSLMQQLPAVAEIMADKLGVTRGALRQLGTEGKVSGALMVQALLDASAAIDAKFGKTFPTITQQLQVLNNRILAFVIDINNRFGIIDKVVSAIDYVGQHMDTLGRVVLGGVFVLGVTAAVYALNYLNAALLANPFTAVAVGITLAIGALIAYSDKIPLAKDSTISLGDVSSVTFDYIRKNYSFLSDEINARTKTMGGTWHKIFGDDFALDLKTLLNIFAKTIDLIVGAGAGGEAAIIVAFSNLPRALEAIFLEALNGVLALVEKMINGVVDGINFISNTEVGKKIGLGVLGHLTIPKAQLTEKGKEMAGDMKTAFLDAFNGSTDATDFLGKVLLKAADTAAVRIKETQERTAALARGQVEFNQPGAGKGDKSDLIDVAVSGAIEKLQEEAAALQQVGVQRAIDNEFIKISSQLSAKGIDLTNAEASAAKAALIQQITINENLKIRAQLMQTVQGRTEENAQAQGELNDLVKQGGDYTAQYSAKLAELQVQQLESTRRLSEGFKAGLLEMDLYASDFAKQSASVVTDAFNSMENAIVRFVTTGKLSFADLMNTILADITKLLLNQIVVQALGALGGALGTGSALGTTLGHLAGKADGGPVSPGKSYMVGERGPEIFTPNTGGSITPNHALHGGAPASVHVHVVNVTDPNDIPKALAHPNNDQIIVNAIKRNKSLVNQLLA